MRSTRLSAVTHHTTEHNSRRINPTAGMANIAIPSLPSRSGTKQVPQPAQTQQSHQQHKHQHAIQFNEPDRKTSPKFHGGNLHRRTRGSHVNSVGFLPTNLSISPTVPSPCASPIPAVIPRLLPNCPSAAPILVPTFAAIGCSALMTFLLSVGRTHHTTSFRCPRRVP